MQPTSHPPQLILTGGTLSASRNADGLLVPSADSLNAALERAGFDPKTAARPYVIDSIDFDIGEHYPKLFAAALAALEDGKTPVVCGGTDTLAWYSTLLTKDLQRHGKLQPDSNEKVIFLSSVKSFEDAPSLIEKILKAGELLSRQNLSGGFAVGAENKTGDRMVVHDVLKHFDKVSSSSSFVNALRSDVPAGYIAGGSFTLNEAYTPPPALPVASKCGLARIAPPLLINHDSEMLLAYLKKIGQVKPPFDGVVVEGLPDKYPLLHSGDQHRLVETVKWLKGSGTRVVFCNPQRFNDETLSMQPVINAQNWNHPITGLAKALADAGAEFRTGLPKDMYLDMMLTTIPENHVSLPVPGNTIRNQKTLGIRYVPDIAAMNAGIDTLAPQIKNLVFSALPHNVMPDSMYPVLMKHRPATKYQATFEYNGSEYVGSDGEIFVEGQEKNPYQSGQRTGALITPCSDSNMTQAINGRAPRPTNTGRASSGSSARSP